MALFTLIACSEDVYQETDKMNENNNVVAPPTIDPAVPYDSPFNDYFTTESILYQIDNEFYDDIEIIGHFGFAYFDGAEDGVYFGNDLSINDTPNIFLINATEYVNTVFNTPLTVGFNSNVTLQQPQRLPILNTGGPAFLVNSIYGGNATDYETEMLYPNGKLYYVDVNIPSIGFSTRIKVKFGDDDMDFVQLSSISPLWDVLTTNLSGANGDLVYNIDTNEICLANDSSGNGLRSEDTFIDNAGTTWYVRAFTDVNGVYITVTP